MTLRTGRRVPAPLVPARTVVLGGSGLALAGALQLVAVLGFLVPATGTWLIPVLSIAAIVMFVSAGVLALGVPGEAGISGLSLPGRLALGLLGCSGFLDLGVVLLALRAGPSRGAIVLALVAVRVLVLAATTTAAIAVLRARLLTGSARWVLFLLVGADALNAGLQFERSTGGMSTLDTYVVRPALVTIVGLVLFVHGRRRSRE